MTEVEILVLTFIDNSVWLLKKEAEWMQFQWREYHTWWSGNVAEPIDIQTRMAYFATRI